MHKALNILGAAFCGDGLAEAISSTIAHCAHCTLHACRVCRCWILCLQMWSGWCATPSKQNLVFWDAVASCKGEAESVWEG
eukprot:scaffold117068_cov21-Tisochrysis_lutea.AAC.1